MLVKTLHGGTTDFDALLAGELATIPAGPEKTAGVKVGALAAVDMLTARANDGAAAGEGPYKPGTKPGNY